MEHPEASHAWAWHGLIRPPRAGRWWPSDEHGGYSCCVEQGHYGHAARKATWLYACKVQLPELKWGSSGPRMRLDDGFHSKEERRRSTRRGVIERLAKWQLAATPPEFRDVLLSIAATAA